MDTPQYRTALIVGAGEGISASFARLLAKQGLRVALAARHPEKLAALCRETGATAYACDATSADDVARLFETVEREAGAPDVVLYNASARARGPFVELAPDDPLAAGAKNALIQLGVVTEGATTPDTTGATESAATTTGSATGTSDSPTG